MEVAHITRGPLLQTLATTGRVAPRRVDLAGLVTGRVQALPGRVGEQLAEGDVVVELDDTAARARVEEAEAGLARARADRRTLTVLGRREAEEALAQAHARLEEAQDNHARLSRLTQHGAVARSALQQAETALALAQSSARAADSTLQGLTGAGPRTRVAEALEQQAEAALSLARINLDQHRLRAPGPSVLVERGLEVGDIVQAGASAAELLLLGDVELSAELDERSLALVAVGQRALASAEAFPERHFEAGVSFVAPTIDPARGTVEVRLHVPDPPAYLRPEMTVSIDIEIQREPAALALPRAAIRSLSEAPHVLVLENGLAVRKDVTLGIADDARVQITGGLADEPVILTSDVSPGQRVVAREVKSPDP